MLQFCSPFLNEQAYFGCYPNEQQFNELVREGFTYFVDLTTLRERRIFAFDYSLHIPKHQGLFYLNFSIIDNNVPVNQELFLEFISFLTSLIQQNKKIYIHCKGGHGRSSLIVASLLCNLFLYTPTKAFSLTKACHEKRADLKDKYRGMSCPQLYSQRKYIMDIYRKKTYEKI